MVILNFGNVTPDELLTGLCIKNANGMLKALSPYLGGGGGMFDFANPTHATMPTARIIHPNMSYFRSLLFFGFPLCKQ